MLSSYEKKRLRNKYGSWAVVTGASSGIGLELAERLAESGLNLVLNARNGTRLQEIKKRFTERYGIDIKIIDADVSEPGGIDKIIQATQYLQVGLLIVSAGYGTSGEFVDSSLHAEINMLRVNCEALLSITHHYAQLFVKQKRGGIILLSSMVAFQGVPYSANYAATKAYVQSLAEGLSHELSSYGVDVLAAAPGPVESGFAERSNMKMSMSLKPSEIGVPILKALGRTNNVLPGLLTKVLVYSLRTVPRWARVKIMALVMKGFTEHQKNK